MNTETIFASAKQQLKTTGVSIDDTALIKEFDLLGVMMFLKGNTLTLSRIIVNAKHQGNGTRFMTGLCGLADHNKWTLAPDTIYGATSVARLKRFYRRFGFHDNKGRKANYSISESMIRNNP